MPKFGISIEIMGSRAAKLVIVRLAGGWWMGPSRVLWASRDIAYRNSVGKRLIWYAAALMPMTICAVDTQSEAIERLADGVDRVLFHVEDGLELAFAVRTNAAIYRTPMFGLAEQLNTATSCRLLMLGVTPVGSCASEFDVQVLAKTIVQGGVVPVFVPPRALAKSEAASTRFLEGIDDAPARYDESRDRAHRLTLVDALERHGYNITATSRYLGMPRSTVQSQMTKLGLRKTAPRARASSSRAYAMKIGAMLMS